MTIWEAQAERKRLEREPVDWATYRKALIESGMVRDSQERREMRENRGMSPLEGPPV